MHLNGILYIVLVNDQVFGLQELFHQPTFKLMLREFRDFIMRGNVLELAVAVIVAGAFGAVVASFTNDIIMPPLGLALGNVDFTELAITLQHAEMDAAGNVIAEPVQLRYGMFIQKVVDFIIIAFIIFMIIRTYNKVRDVRKKEVESPVEASPPAPSSEELLTEIRDLLKGQNQTGR